MNYQQMNNNDNSSNTKNSLIESAIQQKTFENVTRGTEGKGTKFNKLSSLASQKQIALEKLKVRAEKRLTPNVERDPFVWQLKVFPNMKMAKPSYRHKELWRWIESIRQGERPNPFVAIWPRGSGKSTTAEIATTYLGAFGERFYGWYVSGTQALADLHVESIAALIENPTFAHYYPKMSERKLGKYGNIKGWRRNRLRCNNGFTLDALGLDVGARGSKVEERRPDFIILDDIDNENDSLQVIQKKIQTITTGILPAGSKDVAILAIQNLISNDGFFGQIVSGNAEYLKDRILSGPYPAIEDLEVEQIDGRFIIVGGKPTWEGQTIEICQSQIFSWGYTSFLREAQHLCEDTGSMFSHINFQNVDYDKLPDFERIICVVDPAVTDNDKSDSHGIAIAGYGEDELIYHIWQSETVVGPKESIKTALLKSIEYGVGTIYIEVNQGGNVWRILYDQIVEELGLSLKAPPLVEIKATTSEGGKAERASVMLADYELGKIRHVRGTHKELETALKRFLVKKPYDLVDAAVWAHRKLKENTGWLMA